MNPTIKTINRYILGDDKSIFESPDGEWVFYADVEAQLSMTNPQTPDKNKLQGLRDAFIHETLKENYIEGVTTEDHVYSMEESLRLGWDARDAIAETQVDPAAESLATEVELAKLRSENAQLKIELEYPNCPICNSCGESGCCAAERCMYPGIKPEEIKFLKESLKETEAQITKLTSIIELQRDALEQYEHIPVEKVYGVDTSGPEPEELYDDEFVASETLTQTAKLMEGV